MSVEAVKRLFSYNQWAWKRVFPSLETLPAEDYFAERPFFWDSLHGLAVHGYGAERAWLQRIGGNNPSRLVQPAEFDSFADLKAAWETLWDEWQAYVDALTASELDRKLQFRNTEGIEMYLRMDDVLRHVFNHATEHRSQITPTLAQLGYPTEPLDYARFANAQS
jgi:uncharacterized damage-inducible protein DinB